MKLEQNKQNEQIVGSITEEELLQLKQKASKVEQLTRQLDTKEIQQELEPLNKKEVKQDFTDDEDIYLCGGCNSKLDDGMQPVFCPECGERLEWE